MTTPERPLHDYGRVVCARTDVRVGVPFPMGTYARLELFDHSEDATGARVFDLDPVRNRTGDVWNVWVEGIRQGPLYAYRVDGPYQPKGGHRFNLHMLLLDPFATATIERGLEIAELLAGSSWCYLYSKAVSAAHALKDYTARVIPHCDGVAITLEEAHILWQR